MSFLPFAIENAEEERRILCVCHSLLLHMMMLVTCTVQYKLYGCEKRSSASK